MLTRSYKKCRLNNSDKHVSVTQAFVFNNKQYAEAISEKLQTGETQVYI